VVKVFEPSIHNDNELGFGTALFGFVFMVDLIVKKLMRREKKFSKE